jgi:hypothetical protein
MNVRAKLTGVKQETADLLLSLDRNSEAEASSQAARPEETSKGKE